MTTTKKEYQQKKAIALNKLLKMMFQAKLKGNNKLADNCYRAYRLIENQTYIQYLYMTNRI